MRVVAILMAAVMLFAMAAGCGDDSGDVMEVVLPEFVYVPEIINIPGDIGPVNNNGIAISNDRIYIAVSAGESDEDTGSYNYYGELYSSGFDAAGFSKLPNYTPLSAPISGAEGGSYINSINIDGDGNLWVSETWQFGSYDLPANFDPENDDPWNYEYEELDSGNALRKLDPTGAHLLSVDLGGISDNPMGFYIQSFNIDGMGNVYLAVMDYTSGGNIIYVLDNDGKMQFQLDTSSRWIDRLIRMPDGTIAFMDNRFTDAGNIQMLQTIDAETKSLGGTIEIPGIGFNASIFPGNDEYDLLVSDSDNLYGYTIGAGEPVKLLNWLDSNLLADGMQHIMVLPDGRIMCSSSAYNLRTNAYNTQLVILTEKPYSDLPEKTVLSLATLSTYFIRDIIVQFNLTNPDYRIAVIDYSEFNTENDGAAGLTRLSAEIISGKVPDILDVTSLPYTQYVSKGLLADLYPFIDSDSEINRNDIVDSAFRAAEIDGGLYSIFPSFGVRAIIGPPSVMGTGLSWTLDEFKAVLDAHPDADMPLGGWLTKYSFLQSAISLDIDEYIDWEKGTVNFDSDNFIQLLENANTLPEEYDFSRQSYSEELFPAGRQIMEQTHFFSIIEFQRYKAMFGGEIAFKGFPTKNKSGISLTTTTNLAITASSKNKDGAWEFLRTLLDEKRQIESNDFGFPTNKAVFDTLLEQAIEDSQGGGTLGISSGELYYELPLEPITQTDADMLLSLIDAATGTTGWNVDTALWAIISEEASGYFGGQKSAQEAAKAVQSRASILVSERS